MSSLQSTHTAEASSFNRDSGKVYPSNPPRSPHLAWLNLLTPGLAQIVYGKTGLGIVGVFMTQALGALTRIPNQTLVFMGAVGYLVLLIVSIIDAYKTGLTLRRGKPVSKWRLFPS